MGFGHSPPTKILSLSSVPSLSLVIFSLMNIDSLVSLALEACAAIFCYVDVILSI